MRDMDEMRSPALHTRVGGAFPLSVASWVLVVVSVVPKAVIRSLSSNFNYTHGKHIVNSNQ